MENPMNRSMSAALFAVGICFPAVAQATTRETIITPAERPFPADREVVVREFVERTPTKPVIIREGGTVRPGSVIPDDIPLRQFGGLTDTFYQGYRHFVSPDRKVVIVDPKTTERSPFSHPLSQI
jgi:hypothetical protein